MKFNTLSEARAAWDEDQEMHALRGAIFPDVVSYTPEAWKHDHTLAQDAMPTITTAANSGVPAFLTTLIDPKPFKILFAPNKGAKILGEVKKGTWVDTTAMFPVIEHTGEVSSYGDDNENGHTGANTNWPQRQAYLFQTIKNYGDRELDMAGLARINWASEIDVSASTVLAKFSNLSYFYGIAGLENYGLLNTPNLPASLTPATKAAGGVGWFNNGAVNATANEVYDDLVAMFHDLVNRNAGLVDSESKLVVAMDPASAVALKFTNSFNVNVMTLLKDNFENIRFETAVQYGAKSVANPQGVVGGNFVQMIAEEIEGQETGYCAFNEKMRAHPLIRQLSAYKQKITAGTWGAVIRMPVAFSSMLGV